MVAVQADADSNTQLLRGRRRCARLVGPDGFPRPPGWIVSGAEECFWCIAVAVVGAATQRLIGIIDVGIDAAAKRR